MVLRQLIIPLRVQLQVLLVVICLLGPGVYASWGDRLPEFRECVEVCLTLRFLFEHN